MRNKHGRTKVRNETKTGRTTDTRKTGQITTEIKKKKAYKAGGSKQNKYFYKRQNRYKKKYNMVIRY